MKFKFLFLMFILSLGGCGSSPTKSVMDIELSDHHANIGALQLTKNRSSQIAFQLELSNVAADDVILLGGASDSSGRGETRLLNLSNGDPENSALVGPGHVDVDVDIQKNAARVLYKFDDTGNFRFFVAPQISHMHVDAKFSLQNRSLDVDFDRVGAGINFNVEYMIHKKFNINLMSGRSFYSSDMDESMHVLYFRYEPSSHWHIELGSYVSQMEFEKEANISYETRVLSNSPCKDDCVYAYDGSQNSPTELRAGGLRFVLGHTF